MTTEVRKNVTTLVAGADLTGDASMHKAIAIGGTIAASNAAAVGLLKSKGTTGGAVTVAYEGEMKAVAGAAITGGALVSITTSGFVITAADSRTNIGRALETAASGDLFRGLFNFTNV
jgi:hypothetical protein